MAKAKVSVMLSLFCAERFLSEFLENVAEQSNLDELELSIVHNDPTEAERSILDQYSKKIRMIRLETHRENLYASWNRALKQSTGDYIACWNVDDLRVGDSLERMTHTLDSDRLLGWTFGDFVISSSWGLKKGRYIATPEWSQELGTRGAIGGPFFMFRRNAMEEVGWFDEQFSSGGDFDYTVRLSLQSRGCRTPGLHGYFLNEGLGLSTSGKLQQIERTVIQLRYGIYETLDWRYVHPALRFRILHLLQPDSLWRPVEQLVPHYQQLIDSRKSAAWLVPIHTVLATCRSWLAKKIRHNR